MRVHSVCKVLPRLPEQPPKMPIQDSSRSSPSMICRASKW